MELYLVRHGEATHPAVEATRPLSPHGVAQSTALAAWCRGEGVKVDAILHSGVLRARQTAELVARGVASKAPPEEMRGLRPEDDPRDAAEWLAAETRDLMLVGHLPFMGLLTGELVAGDELQEVVTFSPGSLAHLNRGEDGQFRVVRVRHAD